MYWYYLHTKAIMDMSRNERIKCERKSFAITSICVKQQQNGGNNGEGKK